MLAITKPTALWIDDTVTDLLKFIVFLLCDTLRANVRMQAAVNGQNIAAVYLSRPSVGDIFYSTDILFVHHTCDLRSDGQPCRRAFSLLANHRHEILLCLLSQEILLKHCQLEASLVMLMWPRTTKCYHLGKSTGALLSKQENLYMAPEKKHIIIFC